MSPHLRAHRVALRTPCPTRRSGRGFAARRKPPAPTADGPRRGRLGLGSLLFAGALLCACSAPPPPEELEPLAPPDPSVGFQLKTTPAAIPSGTENQDCYFFRVPAQSDVYVRRILMRQSTGTHHMNIFRVRTIVGLSGEDGQVVKGGNDLQNPCWVSSNWADWPLVANTQSSEPGKYTTDFTLPEGVAHKFAPGELLMLQSHYVNATTQTTPQDAMVWANFEYVPAAQVTAELGTLFATNQNLRICPGESKFFEKVCRVPSPVTVIGANGHFHSRGTRFLMNVWDEQNGKGAQFYESESWDDPPMAIGLDIKIPQNAGVQYRCEYKVAPEVCGNPADGCCFTFGPRVEVNEHCNAFVYYYPKLGTDLPCF